jgi:hypothetical protein
MVIITFLAFPAGGFGAGAWDDCADVEYTYYGLGVRALRGLHGT